MRHSETQLRKVDLIAMPPAILQSIATVCLNDIARLSNSKSRRDQSDVAEARRVLRMAGYGEAEAVMA